MTQTARPASAGGPKQARDAGDFLNLGKNSPVAKNQAPTQAPRAIMTARVDLRLAFLACASARFDLVEAGAMDLDEALDHAFVERFRAIAAITCHCEREIIRHFDEIDRKRREQQLMDWRWSRP
jgi:hypothetical protein